MFGLPCLASFPFRRSCKEGDPKHYLLLALQSRVGRWCIHLRRGQCSFHAGPGIWLGEMPLLHCWNLFVWLQSKFCASNKNSNCPVQASQAASCLSAWPPHFLPCQKADKWLKESPSLTKDHPSLRCSSCISNEILA